MKKISAKQYAISLYEVTESLSENQLSDVISSFVNVLVKNNDIKLVGKISEKFEKYFNLQKGIEKIEISTAKKLDESEKKNILNKMESQLNKKVELEELVDPGLIGGLKVKYDDKLVDGSIKTRLSLLKSKIN